jgi:uncharacterized membrane protein YeiH
MASFSFTDFMDITGTFSFAVAGALAAMSRRLDSFGVLILAFVTAIGGGTVRDLLLGIHPVSWLQDRRSATVIIIAAILALVLAQRLQRFSKLLNIFDSIGLGFFTMVGISKAIPLGLAPGFCIALGTITGCFGGVIRDVLLNNVPLVFRKEIYASASIAGGILFFLLREIASREIAFTSSVILVVAIRLLALQFHWSLPAWYGTKKV